MKKYFFALIAMLIVLSGCEAVPAENGELLHREEEAMSAPAEPADPEREGAESKPDPEPADGPEQPEDVVATVYGFHGGSHSFSGEDSAAVNELLSGLDYRDERCRCIYEFRVDTGRGTCYEVNLTEMFARCEAGQAPLSQEQVQLLTGIFTREV